MVVRVLRVLKNRAAGSIAPTGSFADRRSVCVGADDFHRPGNAAIAGNFAGQSGHWTGKAGATGSHRGGRERPPYNPPQMGAGERNVGRKGKVSGFACRLPCIVGRAISPAGQHGGRRKAAGKVNVHPKHCGNRQLCGTMPSIGPETPRSREALQNKAGIGPGRLGQPEVTAAGVNARPTILHKWVPKKWTLPRAFCSRFCLPFASPCRAGDFARRGAWRQTEGGGKN